MMAEISSGIHSENDSESHYGNHFETDSGILCDNFRFPPDDSDRHLCIMLDTNGFMIPVRFHVDIFGELRRLGFTRFIVPESVVRELDGLSGKNSGVDKTAARVARQMAGKCFILPGKGYADDVITETALHYGIAVLTNDAGLKERLLAENVRVVSLRQKTHLDFVMK